MDDQDRASETVTRRLTDRDAALYTEWTANNRQIRQLLTQMHEISARAAELILIPALQF